MKADIWPYAALFRDAMLKELTLQKPWITFKMWPKPSSSSGSWMALIFPKGWKCHTIGITEVDLSIKDLIQLETGEFAGSSARGGKENA